DEEALRRGSVAPRLHGCLRVPAGPRPLQGLKTRSAPADGAAIAGIARQLGEELDDETLLIVGPGTTTACVLRELGVDGTLLGVDAVRGGRAIVRDAGEAELLAALDGAARAKVVVAPIGGQGFVLGRGNQQI